VIELEANLRHRPLRTVRVAATVVLAAVLALAGAPPAFADPARPTNYQSEVTGMSPSVPGVDARVVGGDAFLELTVTQGLQVVVMGYGAEPYLRFDPDGQVFVNVRSPAHYLNDDRYGQSEVPASASVEAEPLWEVLTEGGRYGWHDHRIHWMAPQPPPGIQRDEVSTVLDWTIPIEVDDESVVISGTLRWLPAISPLPWIGLAAIACVASLGVLRASKFGVPLVSVVGAGLALVVAGAEVAASPLGASAGLLVLGPPTLALILGLLSVLHPQAPIPVAVTAVLLGVWTALRAPVLWMPVLVTGLPAALERTGVAVAMGAALALLYGAIRLTSQSPVAIEGQEPPEEGMPS
jgi:hypothetical protein